MAQFAANKKKSPITSDLFDLKQQREESLKYFLQRFNEVALRIASLDERMAVIAFQKGVSPHEDNLVVISAIIMGYNVKRVLVDQGSSADIMFWEAFVGMKIPTDRLMPYAGTLVGFVGDQVTTRGYADLETTFGQGDHMKTITVRYLVVNAQSSYNILVGRPTLNKLGAVVSTPHLKLKYPLPSGKVGVLCVDQEVARKCYEDSLRARRHLYVTQVDWGVQSIELDLRVSHFDTRPAPAEDVKEVTLAEGRTVKIGVSLTKEDEEGLVTVLKSNISAFAWSANDMPGINPDFLCHHLMLDPKAKSVIQKRRKFGEDKMKAIVEETKKLMAAGHIREIQSPTWLANVVMVRKSNGNWRMCTDFTDLNKACPKDSYLLPNIDSLVDRATYQRLMDKVLAEQLGRNVEAYVDDMVVKSDSVSRHFADLQESFDTLARYQLKLNPAKCSFGVQAGKFLGFLLTHRGIEANPDKCSAIINMRSPATVKEVQQLAGRMASLSRFLSKVADKSLPLFQCLRKNDRFAWTDECERAFGELKQALTSPPILTKPQTNSPLLVYLSASDSAVSAFLVQEKGNSQLPIYFVSRVLQGAEVRYQKIEKLAFTILVTA
uniref:Retrovirus-related Pol polyprotein from transposon 17.6 n=1 Tax=Cajanus cajan TaxID=3821 RepID=A0A151RMF1_CAJCA|nr:Retrovirus-related Pol polyprotein from transposon 17.6 [Cajanus cajan]